MTEQQKNEWIEKRWGLACANWESCEKIGICRELCPNGGVDGDAPDGKEEPEAQAEPELNAAPKPCPFCGENVQTTKTWGGGWTVICDDCGLWFGYDLDHGGLFKTEAEAIATWNDRKGGDER